MNKQEAIDTIENIDTLNINDMIAGQQVDMVIKNQVLDIVRQIHEPQKVVVPKFVAEWIECAKAESYSLYGAMEMVEEDSEIFNWLFNGNRSNQDTFAQAWLFAYEVEQEQLYTVEIPNPNATHDDVYILGGNLSGSVSIWRGIGDIRDYDSNFKLTESEIKQDFEWAWDAGFAKEVK
ncbi:TPA: DUF1642 domain-containing protein [Streptococcus suis]